MKKVFALMAIVAMSLAIGSLAIADEEDLNKDMQLTGRGIYTTPIDPLTDWLNNNDYIMHGHEIFIPTRRNPLGIGLDVVVYQGGGVFEEAVVEAKHDFQNDETSAYLVGRINGVKVAQAVMGLFQ